METLRQSVSLNLQQIGDTINPLDDHKLLLWAMRAGLTRDEMHRGRAHPLATYRGDGLIAKGMDTLFFLDGRMAITSMDLYAVEK